MSSAGLVQCYTADPEGSATPIMVDALSAGGLGATPVQVTTSVDLLQLIPPGWPSPPDETGTIGPSLWYQRTIRGGTTMTSLAPVAAALIAADAATLA